MTGETEAYVLGETMEKIRVDSSTQVAELSLSMAQQSRRLLDICSRHLDPVLYDTEEFLAAVKELALRSRFSQIRLLVLDPQSLASRGHRLLGLAQQLSSFIQIRRPGPDHRDFNESIFIADETGYIHRLMSDRYEGTANFSDPPEAGELLRKFDAIWEKGELDPNFRRLGI